MKVQEVLQHFGGITKTAAALHISYHAVRAWREKSEIPQGRQCQIQLLTGGTLVAAAGKTA